MRGGAHHAAVHRPVNRLQIGLSVLRRRLIDVWMRLRPFGLHLHSRCECVAGAGPRLPQGEPRAVAAANQGPEGSVEASGVRLPRENVEPSVVQRKNTTLMEWSPASMSASENGRKSVIAAISDGVRMNVSAS